MTGEDVGAGVILEEGVNPIQPAKAAAAIIKVIVKRILDAEKESTHFLGGGNDLRLGMGSGFH